MVEKEKGQEQKEKISLSIKKIVDIFISGNIPEAIAIACFPSNKPSDRWSLCNRLIALSMGTTDARGYRQWQEVDRNVRKGAKAFHILAPKIVSIKKNSATEATETGLAQEEKEEKVSFLAGFLTVPVFRIEDTEGKPIEYPEIKNDVNTLPLIDKAKSWGIDVSFVGGNGDYLGCYRIPTSNSGAKIELATESEKTFFHELAHAAHDKLGLLKVRTRCEGEIVAELSAQALACLVGKQKETTIGNSYEYVKAYSLAQGLTVERACLRVISDVEKVLSIILDKKND